MRIKKGKRNNKTKTQLTLGRSSAYIFLTLKVDLFLFRHIKDFGAFKVDRNLTERS